MCHNGILVRRIGSATNLFSDCADIESNRREACEEKSRRYTGPGKFLALFFRGQNGAMTVFLISIFSPFLSSFVSICVRLVVYPNLATCSANKTDDDLHDCRVCACVGGCYNRCQFCIG